MKNILVLASLVTLAACGTAPQSSEANGFPGFNPVRPVQSALPETMTFSKDDRPVDGYLVEVILTKGELTDGGYDVTLRKAWFDRINGVAREESKVVAYGVDCKGDLTSGVTCFRDSRPVDGDLKELKVLPVEGRDFTATLRTAFYDRINGKAIDETKTLGEDLALALPVAVEPRMCTMIAGVLVDPATGKCQGFSNGCEMAALEAKGYTRLEDGMTCGK